MKLSGTRKRMRSFVLVMRLLMMLAIMISNHHATRSCWYTSGFVTHQLTRLALEADLVIPTLFFVLDFQLLARP